MFFQCYKFLFQTLKNILEQKLVDAQRRKRLHDVLEKMPELLGLSRPPLPSKTLLSDPPAAGAGTSSSTATVSHQAVQVNFPGVCTFWFLSFSFLFRWFLPRLPHLFLHLKEKWGVLLRFLPLPRPRGGDA